LSFSKETNGKHISPIDAATPDARFIYEAIDAAKSLLTRVNDYVVPDTLRYMPCTYFLFIIYSAVFLYKVSVRCILPVARLTKRKARATTNMSEDERSDIRHLVIRIIDLLRKSSTTGSDMGSRYARLLQLLWNRPTKRAQTQPPQKIRPQSIDHLLIQPPDQQNMVPEGHVYDPNSYNALQIANADGVPPSGNTFSWLDLGAAFSFATQNNTLAQTAGELPDMSMGDSSSSGFSPYDLNMNMLTDYRLLNDENATLIF
jgi:hypothetical protein